MRYAEVIGAPVAQSKSPTIHKYWLDELKLEGEYRRTHVPKGMLAEHFRRRRSDPEWLGCNVTVPHKEEAAELVDELDDRAQAIGAINCVVPRAGGLFGTNTDIDGIGSALNGTALGSAKTVVIGGGGAARAAVAYLAGRNIRELVILVRNPERAESLRSIAPGIPVVIEELSLAEQLMEGAAAIINATQLGMTGCAEMPACLIDNVARHSHGSTLFDMVYDPLETRFLATGRQAGARVIDGLTMLVGQAGRGFGLFFGATAPAPDAGLRDLLSL